jgi:hypothetical protein
MHESTTGDGLHSGPQSQPPGPSNRPTSVGTGAFDTAASKTGQTDRPSSGATASGSAAGESDLQRNARDTARTLADELKRAGTEKAGSGLETAAATTERLAESVGAAARQFDDDAQPMLGRITHEAADAIDRVSRQLRTADVDQLVGQARTLARTNPALFTLGAVAVGFGLSRFFKASEQGARRSTIDPGPVNTTADKRTTTAAGQPWQSSFATGSSNARGLDSTGSPAGRSASFSGGSHE